MQGSLGPPYIFFYSLMGLVIVKLYRCNNYAKIIEEELEDTQNCVEDIRICLGLS